jgi:hypothetical protein
MTRIAMATGAAGVLIQQADAQNRHETVTLIRAGSLAEQNTEWLTLSRDTNS